MSTRKEVTNDDDDVSSSDVGGSSGGSPGGEADNSQLQAPAHDSSARRDDGGLVGGWQDHSPGDEPETAPAEIRHVVERQAYQGPLPHPQDFAGFEEVLPGAADRILSMAEKRQQAEIDQRIMTSRAEARAFVGAAWAVSFFPWALTLLTAGLLAAGQTIPATAAGIAAALAAARRSSQRHAPSATRSNSSWLTSPGLGLDIKQRSAQKQGPAPSRCRPPPCHCALAADPGVCPMV